MANCIKEVMSSRNISSADLSEMTGLSKVAISNIITCKSSPSLDNAVLIAKALGVSLDAIVEYKEEINDAVVVCPNCGERIKLKAESLKKH